jgi:hypothetical protein
MPSFFELKRQARTSSLAAAALAVLAATAAPQAHAAAVANQGTWQTTLQGRDLDGNSTNGFEAYYDTTLNITWLADANQSKTSGYDADGFMDWGTAKAWVANLSVNGISGWRLPTMVDTGAPGCDFAYSGTDCGWNVNTSSSELAHLFYVTLGNKGFYNTSGTGGQSGWGLSNSGPFRNFAGGVYWFDVQYALVPDDVWSFDNRTGFQFFNHVPNPAPAWAVRPGDVAAVPEPQAYALALAGLAVAGVVARTRHR